MDQSNHVNKIYLEKFGLVVQLMYGSIFFIKMVNYRNLLITFFIRERRMTNLGPNGCSSYLSSLSYIFTNITNSYYKLLSCFVGRKFQILSVSTKIHTSYKKNANFFKSSNERKPFQIHGNYRIMIKI